MQSEFSVKIVLFNQGEDPADMIANNKIDILTGLFHNAQNSVEFLLNYIVDKYDLTISTQKQQAFNEVMLFFKTLHVVMQNDYKVYLANLLNVDSSIIYTTSEKKKLNRSILVSEDIAELRVLKTIILNEKLFIELLDCIIDDYFLHHKKEFLDILQSKDCRISSEILLREDILELNEENFFNQIINLSLRFYKSLKKKQFREEIKSSSKFIILRKIEQIIKNLNNNTLPIINDNEILNAFKI
jgi:DNA primase